MKILQIFNTCRQFHEYILALNWTPFLYIAKNGKHFCDTKVFLKQSRIMYVGEKQGNGRFDGKLLLYEPMQNQERLVILNSRYQTNVAP